MEGKCHICAERKQVAFCALCGHWFCPGCSEAYAQRAIAAIKDMIIPAIFCCGPNGK